jgi:multimeric flavodoxin WrbA
LHIIDPGSQVHAHRPLSHHTDAPGQAGGVFFKNRGFAVAGMIRVLAINGSYRDNGVTDQIVNAMAQAVEASGNKIEVVRLRDYPIEFCLNCRECTQQPGIRPGQCVHKDGMGALLEKIEVADAYILASPTNFGSVTAVFKRFMERLIVYAYWPWGKATPRFRKTGAKAKRALLVSSSAAPGLLGRWSFATRNQLKTTARTIGAKPVGTLFTGLVATHRDHRISETLHVDARGLVKKLLRD